MACVCAASVVILQCEAKVPHPAVVVPVAEEIRLKLVFASGQTAHDALPLWAAYQDGRGRVRGSENHKGNSKVEG